MVIREQAIEITNQEFKSVLKEFELVVVDFFAEWCMPCLMLSPVIEELSKKLKKIKFVKIDIEDNEELTRDYKIFSIPCLIISKNGIEIHRIIGNQSAERIEEEIKKLMK